jgi:uncharacterized repeat protein (TIGR02543 family)
MREHRDTSTLYRVSGILLLIGVLLMGSCSDFILDMEGKTVVFDSRGGSEIEDQVFFTEGSLLEEPADPIREGYCFAGWYRDQACSQAWDFSQHGAQRSLTLYAKWVEEVSVTIDSQGGSSVTEQTGITAGTCATEPADPTREGYTFSGWFTDAACTDSWEFLTDEVTDDMTLFAGWDLIAYTVSFDSQGGSSVTEQTGITAGTCAAEPADPTWEGYTFSGWFTDAACTDSWEFLTDEVTDDMTLYAGWQTALLQIVPSTVLSNNNFGKDIAIDGDHLIASSYDLYSKKGSVYSFTYTSGEWEQQQRLLSPGGVRNDDRFGYSIDISGDYMIVGRDRDTTSTLGSVCFYHYDGTQWELMETIYEPDTTSNNHFSRSVAIDGEYAVVGAAFYDYKPPYSSSYRNESGRAYVFHRNGDSWSTDDPVALDPRNPEEGALFGSHIDIDGDRIVISAPGDDDDDGSVYVYEREGSSWVQQTPKITAFERYNCDEYGSSVAIDGDWIVVGAEKDQMTGITEPGSAFVYHHDTATDSWQDELLLRPEFPLTSERFGADVAIEGDRILIGAFQHREGDQLNLGGVYIFDRTGTEWEERKIILDDPHASDYFGMVVAMDGENMIASSTNRKVDGKSWAGAVYLFE